MAKKMSLIGHRYGRLLVTGEPSNNTHPFKWECQCDCGNTTVVFGVSIRSGRTTSCGCYSQESKTARMTRHGNARTRLHIIWRAMIRRCYEPSASNYHDYGAIGVRVYDEWLNSYEAFEHWSLLNGYKDGLSIDRIAGALLYGPHTCRWADNTTQARNKRKRQGTTSNYIGVSYVKSRNKFLAMICVHGKHTNLGRYNTEEEAARARDNYIKENQLENYTLNFP